MAARNANYKHFSRDGDEDACLPRVPFDKASTAGANRIYYIYFDYTSFFHELIPRAKTKKYI